MSSLAAAKADNFYYPPDFDPKKHQTLNKYNGQHPLRERAAKLDQGILVIRFEIPFNIWCDKCGEHIAKGERFNAEKKAIGQYHSTKILQFCMTHHCGCRITIQTDPKNAEYLVVEGARKKEESYSAADAEVIELPDEEEKERRRRDPLYRLEYQQHAKAKALSGAERLAAIQDIVDARAADPYDLNRQLRAALRGEKRSAAVLDERRAALGLPQEVALLPASDGDALAAQVAFLTSSARAEAGAEARRKRILDQDIFSSSSSSTAAASVRGNGAGSGSGVAGLEAGGLGGKRGQKGACGGGGASGNGTGAEAGLGPSGSGRIPGLQAGMQVPPLKRQAIGVLGPGVGPGPGSGTAPPTLLAAGGGRHAAAPQAGPAPGETAAAAAASSAGGADPVIMTVTGRPTAAASNGLAGAGGGVQVAGSSGRNGGAGSGEEERAAGPGDLGAVQPGRASSAAGGKPGCHSAGTSAAGPSGRAPPGAAALAAAAAAAEARRARVAVTAASKGAIAQPQATTASALLRHSGLGGGARAPKHAALASASCGGALGDLLAGKGGGSGGGGGAGAGSKRSLKDRAAELQRRRAGPAGAGLVLSRPDGL